MSSSDPAGIEEVARWLKERLRPPVATQVVDFGCGWGRLGSLVRSLAPDVTISACDVYEPNVKRHAAKYREPYDSVEHMTIEGFSRVAPTGPGTLWMFGDVLEHLPPVIARAIVATAEAELILVRIPIGPYPQKGTKANPSEAHLWTAYPEDIINWGRPVLECRVNRIGSKKIFFDDMERRPVYDNEKAFIGNFLLGART